MESVFAFHDFSSKEESQRMRNFAVRAGKWEDVQLYPFNSGTNLIIESMSCQDPSNQIMYHKYSYTIYH